MLECSDGSIYTGVTVDLPKRLNAHAAGKGSKYVRSRLPVTLAAWWKFAAPQSDILKLERFLKSLPGHRKRELVENPGLLEKHDGKQHTKNMLLLDRNK